MTREELKQLSAETFYDNNEGGITPYAHREFNAHLIDSIPDGTVQIPLTDIPIGYNLRGKTITFTNTELIPDEVIGFNRYEMKFRDISDFHIVAGIAGPRGGCEIWFSNGRGTIYSANTTGWLLSSYTFPKDRDYIIESNSLPRHTATGWGFDYAVISGSIEDAFSYKQDKLIPGSGIKIASDTRTISAQTFTPTFVVDSDTALAQWAGNVSGYDYTYVLIKSGTWTVMQSINLSTAGTIGIVGEPKAEINIQPPRSSLTGFVGMYYDNAPAKNNNTFCIGVTIYVTTGIGSSFPATIIGAKNLSNIERCYITAQIFTVDGSAYNTAYGLWECSGIRQCQINAITNANGAAAYTCYSCSNMQECVISADGYQLATGLHNCNSIYNCKVTSLKGGTLTGMASCSDLLNCSVYVTTAGPCIAFSDCKGLVRCRASVLGTGNHSRVCYSTCMDLYSCGSQVASTGSTLQHFINCRAMFGCHPLSTPVYGTVYSTCYMNASGTSYLVSDSPNGGFNRTTV